MGKEVLATGATRHGRRSLAAGLFAILATICLAACTPASYAGISFRPGAAAPDLQALARRAQAGDKRAQLELGIRYEEGRGVARDLSRAEELYEAAATNAPRRVWTYAPSVAGVPGQPIQVSIDDVATAPESVERRLRLLRSRRAIELAASQRDRVEDLLRRMREGGSAEIARAERRYQPLLDRQSTSGYDGQVVLALRALIVRSILEEDQTTYRCNELSNSFAGDVNPLGRALDTCMSDPQVRVFRCDVYADRKASISEFMRLLSQLYSDARLELSPSDALRLGLQLGCPLGAPETSPRADFRYSSDILSAFAAARLRGANPLATFGETAIVGPRYVGMGRYRISLQTDCRLPSEFDRTLLRTIECKVSGLRKGTS